jgi:hypothetical protein
MSSPCQLFFIYDSTQDAPEAALNRRESSIRQVSSPAVPEKFPKDRQGLGPLCASPVPRVDRLLWP